LIGVFASQLAGETWDFVLAEVEAENSTKADDKDESDDGIVREVFGKDLPQWMVGFQLSLKEADIRVNELIAQEYDAKVWNCTDSRGNNPIPPDIDPAMATYSPERTEAFKGIDLAASLCDGLVLSPNLFQAFLKYSDPLFDEQQYKKEREEELVVRPVSAAVDEKAVPQDPTKDAIQDPTKDAMMEQLAQLRYEAEEKLKELEQRVKRAEKQTTD